ncbi:UNVERIFIED_CONTAM: hypothetical protein NCL1_23690 [Trichonephila clavipes]
MSEKEKKENKISLLKNVANDITLRPLYRGSTMIFEKLTLFSVLQPIEIIIVEPLYTGLRVQFLRDSELSLIYGHEYIIFGFKLNRGIKL